MGFYGGAKICELVGLYLLNPLSNVIDKSGVGLCRDNALIAIYNANGPKLDRIMKDINALFKEEGLQINIETNYLQQITFNLESKKYFRFRKVNNTSLCINAFSNHLPKISCLKWLTTEFQIYPVIRKISTKLKELQNPIGKLFMHPPQK